MTVTAGLWISVFMTFSATVMNGQQIYVSPGGKEYNPGTREKPVSTFEAAQVLARQVHGQQLVEVIFMNGIYYLPQTVRFTPRDSRKDGARVVFRSEVEGGAVLSGGSLLKLRWKPYMNGIFVAKVHGNPVIDQLYINGVRQRMARFPNAVEGKNVFDTWDLSHKAAADTANDSLSPQRIKRWKDPAGGYIHTMHEYLWGDMHWIITGKNENGELEYQGGWQNNRPSKMHPRFRIVENIFEELDAPGEWFYDSHQGKLYFFPPAGMEINLARTEIVRLGHLVEFSGSRGDPVTNVHLQGFIFRHAARTFMEQWSMRILCDMDICTGAVCFSSRPVIVIRQSSTRQSEG